MAGKTSAKLTIKPLYDNVLIRPVKADTQTASGIILPETTKEKPQMGEVVAVGAGVYDNNGKLIPMAVKIGQKVLYKKWGGDEVKIEHEEWKLVRQNEILAIVD